MYQFIALIELAIFIFVMRKFLKEDGIISLVDGSKVMLMLWGGATILYNFKLSNLYSPTIEINLITFSIFGGFLILSRYTKLKDQDIKEIAREFEDDSFYKIYSILSTIIFVVGTVVFIYNVIKHGFRITASNKIDKQDMDHYGAYFVYMLILAGEIKYLLFRNYKKVIDAIIFVGTILVLALTLNRGPIGFLFITIGIYEVFNFINIKENISKKKKYGIYAGFFALIAGFIWFFGYVGNMRMEYVLRAVYKRTLWQHYGVSIMIPSGLLWVYMYLTSPIENVAYALANQHSIGNAFLSNLFYPFIKFIANIFGCGNQFKDWLISRGAYTPYLEKKVGLNAMTFIPESFQDGNVVGFIIYLLIYILLAYIAIRIIKSKKDYTPVGRILIYTNIVSMLLWSIFVNSFKIPILILNIFLLLFVEKFIRVRKAKKGKI